VGLSPAGRLLSLRRGRGPLSLLACARYPDPEPRVWGTFIGKRRSKSIDQDPGQGCGVWDPWEGVARVRWRFNAPPVHVVLAHTNVRCRRRIKRQTTAQATLFVHMLSSLSSTSLGVGDRHRRLLSSWLPSGVTGGNWITGLETRLRGDDRHVTARARNRRFSLLSALQPAGPYKDAIESRFTVGNAQAA
jgi:hypothetical protein